MLRLVTLVCLAVACLGSPVIRLDGKIVGGEPVEIEDYPFQLSLEKSGRHACGASIISAEWAVTAAHCVSGGVDAMVLRAGTSIKGSGGTTHQVIEKIVHEQYDSFQFDYDICVLKVGTPFEFGATVATIVLPAQDESVADGVISDISGWGALSEGGSSPNQLQAVKVPVISNEACGDSYGASAITDRMICAGVPEGGKDSCQGDSGGPMTAEGKLVGIVSWGRGCARPDYPGVYSRVASMRSWITEKTGV